MVDCVLDSDLVPTPLPGSDGKREIELRPPLPLQKFRGLFVLRHAGGFLLWLARRRLRGRPSAVELAAALRGLFESLGGLWIKLGQLVAMRRDLLPSDFCSELGRLQDRAAGFPGEVSRRILEEDLGRPLETAFDSFEERPFAAASIGQLHRARLRERGVWVAVKVQRPHVKAVVERDLALVGFLCDSLHWLHIQRSFHWRDLTRELSGAIREELDYRLEATSIARMRRTLRHHGVYVPRVFTRFCTNRVLTMEFVSGALMSDFIALRESDPQAADRWLAANQVRQERVGRRLHISLMRQILEDNLFHGDLHPGNIILLRRSRVALIDFGSIGTLEARFQELYRRLLRSMSDLDFEKTADMVTLIAPAPDGEVDWERGRRNAAGSLRQAELRAWAPNLKYAERSMTRALLDVVRSQAVLHVPVGWAFMRVDRAHVTLDSSLMYLVPDVSYFALGQSYFAGANKRSLGPELRAQLNDRLRPGRALPTLIEIADRLALAQGRVHGNAAFRSSKRDLEILVEFAAGMLGRGLLALAVLTAAVVGARQLPPPFAEPLARSLPALTGAAPRLHWATGALAVAALMLAAVRLIGMERSLTPHVREEAEPGDEVA
jgi:ubiquinone biosynthesis protein